MKWTVHGERIIYDSEWVRLALTDVEIPGGARFEHHVVRMPAAAAGTVIVDSGPVLGSETNRPTETGNASADLRILLLWRHRFTTDSWGWEVPAGRIDDGETPIEAAGREAYEETGWQPGPLRHLTTYFPHNGSSDATFHLFVAEGATHIGDPPDASESERVEWLTIEDLLTEINDGRVGDGLSLTALLWWLTFEYPKAVQRR